MATTRQETHEQSATTDREVVIESFLTFTSEGASTRLEMRTLFPTKEARDEAVEKFGAIEGGRQTLGKLAAYVTENLQGEAD